MDKTIKLWYFLLCTTTVNNWFLERRQETGHQPLSLHLVLRFCCHFLISLNPESYVVRQLVKQLVNKVYCAKDKSCFTCGEANFHGNSANMQNIMVIFVVSISQHILVLGLFVKIKQFIFYSPYCRFVGDCFPTSNTYMNTLTLIRMKFSIHSWRRESARKLNGSYMNGRTFKVKRSLPMLLNEKISSFVVFDEC